MNDCVFLQKCLTYKYKKKMNINKCLDKAYEKMELKEILNAPVDAIQGVSARDAELLKEAFNIKTVSDLGNCKYFRWARAICILAEGEE